MPGSDGVEQQASGSPYPDPRSYLFDSLAFSLYPALYSLLILPASLLPPPSGRSLHPPSSFALLKSSCRRTSLGQPHLSSKLNGGVVSMDVY